MDRKIFFVCILLVVFVSIKLFTNVLYYPEQVPAGSLTITYKPSLSNYIYKEKDGIIFKYKDIGVNKVKITMENFPYYILFTWDEFNFPIYSFVFVDYFLAILIFCILSLILLVKVVTK